LHTLIMLFFCDVTSSYEIYSLSLHDALPILVQWVVDAEPELLDVALAARPTLLSVSFGADYGWVERAHAEGISAAAQVADVESGDRKSTRLNSSHVKISYAVFCLKKKIYCLK